MENQILEDLHAVDIKVGKAAKTFNKEFYYAGRFIPTISQRINRKIMFVAEMPTYPSKKDKWNPKDNFFLSKSDLKFVKLLNKLGLDGCYITDIVKTCAKARRPTPEELETFKGILLKEIEVIQPQLIVSLGESADNTLNLFGIVHENVWHPSYPDRKNDDKGLWLEYEEQLKRVIKIASLKELS